LVTYGGFELAPKYTSYEVAPDAAFQEIALFPDCPVAPFSGLNNTVGEGALAPVVNEKIDDSAVDDAFFATTCQ
jgi:hypothetical protein